MDGFSPVIVQLLLGIVSGTALFILAVSYLESAIRALAGRKVKRILRGTTSRPGIALIFSALITALLQGSSVVLLLLLSLVGAGVLPLRNALAVMLGANLGTTLDTWLVIAVGFKLQLELFAVPFLLLAGTLALVGKGERSVHWSRFAVGLGLFFLSLGMLRDAFSADSIPKDWINSAWPLPLFSLAGLVLTALIQSSLAVTVLAAAAVHGGVMDLAPAAALVLGAEIGTTIKLFFGSTDGSLAKRRLAWANLIINLGTALVLLVVLRPVLSLAHVLVGDMDDVFVLVMFQTLVNLVSVIMFYPFLGYFSSWLERFVRGDAYRKCLHLGEAPPRDPDLALELFRRESETYLKAACIVNLAAMRLPVMSLLQGIGFSESHPLVRSFSTHGSLPYEYMKSWQGELQLYYLSMRNIGQDSVHAEEGDRMASAVRNAMHGLKSMHDIRDNLHELRESTSEIKHEAYHYIREGTRNVFESLLSILDSPKGADEVVLAERFEQINSEYESTLERLYTEAARSSIDSRAFTVMMNLNREVYAAKKAMLLAVRELLVPKGSQNGNWPLFNS